MRYELQQAKAFDRPAQRSRLVEERNPPLSGKFTCSAAEREMGDNLGAACCKIIKPIVIYGALDDNDVEAEQFWNSISADVESNYSLTDGPPAQFFAMCVDVAVTSNAGGLHGYFRCDQKQGATMTKGRFAALWISLETITTGRFGLSMKTQ